METATQTPPEQIYDMDSGKMVANPEFKPANETETETEVETDEESEEEKPDAPAEKGKKKEEPAEEGEGEEEESEEEEEEEEQEEEKPAVEAKGKKTKNEEEAVTADDYIAEVFSEKYGVKTEADLIKLLELGADAHAETESLKKKISESGEPKFKDPKKQSAFDLISKFDPKHQGEALQTWAKLVAMPVDEADAMMVLEEKFIHDHPEYNRTQGQRMFKKDFDKRYTLKRDDFETDEQYNEEVKDMEIMKSGEVAKARTFLKDLQSKHKPSDTEEKPVVNELVTKAVEKNAKDYTDAVDKKQEFTFESDGVKYTYKLDGPKKKLISDALATWVKNPVSYDEKGNLIGAGTIDESINTYIGGIFLNDILTSFASQMKNQVAGKRIEEIGEKKPRKTTGGDGKNAVVGDDMDSSARMLIKKKRAA